MSKDEQEYSLSGDPIFRYTDGEKEWQSPMGEECIVQISEHIERHIGEVTWVFHEVISDTVHIDVHYVAPTDERPFHTLVTSGMSDLPMSTPEEADIPRFMELMITLPAHWQISQEAFSDEQWYWPVRQLKFLARFPHKYDSWLGWGHTIPNGEPAEPFAENTRQNGMIVLPSLLVDEGFHTLEIDQDKCINFYSLVPLYEEEMMLKLEQGSDALLDLFDKYQVSDLVDVARINVVTGRK
ncbi:MAG: suppressor of fused domain protein [Shewanella algae]